MNVALAVDRHFEDSIAMWPRQCNKKFRLVFSL